MKSGEASVPPSELEQWTDSELANRVVAGELTAFAALMRRHNRKLYRAARAISGDSAEAEDIVQETWVRAYAHLPSFRRESAFSTWLRRILINEALGRKRRAKAVIGLNETSEQQMSSVIMFPNCGLDPESSVWRAQVSHLVEQAIDALPTDFRLVFVLRVVEDMSGSEVAEQLGIPEATVKTRLYRARALIQKELAKNLSCAFVDMFPFGGARCEALSTRVMRRLGLLSAGS
jgi:RNA polymerase sigma-70 factor (ECF subfamily)